MIAGGATMSADTMMQEQDIYAEQVSRILTDHGLLQDEEEREMKQFLRGW